ncbi:MAG: D-hexose-6-phosphate mutarotase [Blastochloris viridis]|uniref:Putative glucose-6-phosphate 1-epimerase n=1 Tax=Blastochloris viridis TaxID=1079 RepID=A0A6N4QZ60_BLAVI|nr:MAG: D-hexose-6-phosphate mutarotase [Blastochloris viridis]
MQLLTLRTAHATATISAYGAQVMSFVPHGQSDVLWSTTPEFLAAARQNRKALRGGIPLCWPWFLGLNDHPDAPSHGLARISEWQLTAHTETPDASTATYELELDGNHPAWPYRTHGRLTITLTSSLTVELTTTNLSEQPFKLTQALHTYLNVADIANAALSDLKGLTRRHVSSGTPLPEHEGPFTITEEVEHLVSPVHRLTLTEPGRRIYVANTGSTEFVIWNPWADKAAKLDMPPHSYKNMLCLEAANIDKAPTLQPGQSHILTTTLAPMPY